MLGQRDAVARLHAPLLQCLASARRTPPRRKLSRLQVPESRRLTFCCMINFILAGKIGFAQTPRVARKDLVCE
ncbi:hypothetical protein DM860_011385 [Cuscuta australis]|uniref:Uncharacterized protein n=1 Tax=Cuscuta australis TaxID=267555 RepID=A0A328DPR2_9ASTE|nr:hypothetical protein DM860_011385 [Cuscuta australis]